MRPSIRAMRRTVLLALCAVAAACADEPAARVAGPVEPAAPRANTLWPGAPVYQQDTTYGVVATWLHPWERDTLLNLTQRSGVGWVRLTAYWPMLQPYGVAFEPDSLALLKAQISAARQRGLRVFLTLEGTPGWSRLCGTVSPCGDSRYPPHDNFWNSWQAYTHDLADSLSAYPYDVQAWGILNEVNSSAFFQVQAGRDPVEEYKKFVLYAEPYLRRNGARLVVGDLAQGGTYGGSAYTWAARLSGEIGGHWDVLAVHQYNASTCTENDMRRFRDALAANGGSGKRLWLTEAGQASNVTTPALQATMMAGYLTEMKDASQTAGCGWDPDQPSGDADWDLTFAYHLKYEAANPNTHLVEPGTLLPRPAFDCLSWFARGKPGAAPADCVRTGDY